MSPHTYPLRTRTEKLVHYVPDVGIVDNRGIVDPPHLIVQIDDYPGPAHLRQARRGPGLVQAHPQLIQLFGEGLDMLDRVIGHHQVALAPGNLNVHHLFRNQPLFGKDLFNAVDGGGAQVTIRQDSNIVRGNAYGQMQFFLSLAHVFILVNHGQDLVHIVGVRFPENGLPDAPPLVQDYLDQLLGAGCHLYVVVEAGQGLLHRGGVQYSQLRRQAAMILGDICGRLLLVVETGGAAGKVALDIGVRPDRDRGVGRY